LVPIGHGEVDNFPDLPYLKWSFEFQTHAAGKERNNQETFLEATQHLFSFLMKYQAGKSTQTYARTHKEWAEIKDEIVRLLSIPTTKDKRIEAWKSSIAQGNFCSVTEIDRNIDYSKSAWLPQSLSDMDFSKTSLESCPIINFYKSATRYREFIYKVLLPECGLCV
jgi:hypothetical protein